MRDPAVFTLGEIRTILQIEKQGELFKEAENLFLFLQQREQRLLEYQAATERAEVEKPRPLPRRRCQSLDVDLLDSCTLIDAGL